MKALPSINALLAFEAAARRGSVARAADELALTESAVSKQIAALELRLGLKLFHRIKQRLYLTRAGQTYRDKVSEILARLERDTLEVMAYQGDGGILEIATLPTVGASWLVPKIKLFCDEFPGIHVNLKSRNERFLFTGSDIDAALYFGDANWPGATVDFLFEEFLVPVGAIALAGGAPLSEDTLRSSRLVHLTTRPDAWKQWCDTHGFSGVNVSSGPRCDTQAMVIQAAACGLGVALVPDFLAQPEIQRGSLSILSPQAIKSPGAYYIAVPDAKASSPPLAAFRKWLNANAGPTPNG